MLPQPSGPVPTPEQVLELDAEYLAGDVTGYFSSRIDALIAWHDAPTGADFSSGLGAQVARLLSATPEDLADTPERDRQLQVAVDAFALRQHVAETLVRFLEARVALIDTEAGKESLWFTVATGPTPVADAVESMRAGLSRTDRPVFAELMFLADVLANPNVSAVNDALRLTNEWINHACILLTRDDLPLASGNNKSKHGMAIRHVDDERVTLVASPLPDPARVPLSAVDGTAGRSLDLVDRPVMKILTAKPTKRGTVYSKGSDQVWIILDAASLLAEATVLNEVLRAAMHTAAFEHRARTGVPLQVVPFPDLTKLPQPSAVLKGRHVTGLRLPVTEPTRLPAIVLRRVGDERTLSFKGPAVYGSVVADEESDTSTR
ncbi:hypothetical protein [Oerskovia gallyi]|uniref:Uncharacterized protein n=1 Tax=Oerskovia gallyi TaxID=2762226 RepID=A0ABR8V409_9CELL|nr:hypothetical protein [Oerskovia gallyi]MBD7999545.1 hypothetical protein [Oerskovia gallyi]